jgi:hypothetical protein
LPDLYATPLVIKKRNRGAVRRGPRWCTGSRPASPVWVRRLGLRLWPGAQRKKATDRRHRRTYVRFRVTPFHAQQLPCVTNEPFVATEYLGDDRAGGFLGLNRWPPKSDGPLVRAGRRVEQSSANGSIRHDNGNETRSAEPTRP